MLRVTCAMRIFIVQFNFWSQRCSGSFVRETRLAFILISMLKKSGKYSNHLQMFLHISHTPDFE